jgi:hypothetical protein
VAVLVGQHGITSEVKSTAPDHIDTVTYAQKSDKGQEVLATSALRSRATDFYGALSASYATSTNWGGQDLRNYSSASNLLYRHNLFSDGYSHAHLVAADLGYLKFVDSTWVKHMDRLQVNLLWYSGSRKLNHSYSLVLATQFLPNTVLEYNLETLLNEERSVGGFMNPFTLDGSYGAVWSFWQGSNINFAFATLRFSAAPKSSIGPAFTDASMIEGLNAYYFVNYGFSFTTAIKKPIGKHLEWINNSRFFVNGVNRNNVNFDFNNMVVVKLWKYIQLRIDTRFAYNPMLNYDLQFRQEVLLGFFYERKK